MTASMLPIRPLLAPCLLLLLALAAALGGCETTGGPAPQAAAPKPPTHEEASLQCWMATEKDAAKMSLDKRADVVDACIDRKMKGEPDAPATAAVRPDSQAEAENLSRYSPLAARLAPYHHVAIRSQRMIPKSVQRFSDKIMRH